ncbi:MAG: outer membrane lipid asymmetry maintenance protein MlaD [Rickettsiales bacterium]
MRRNLIETIIGFLVIVIAAIFFVFSYKVADVKKLESTYDLIAKFDQVEGIVVGSDVAISGIKVGVVKALSLDPKDYYAKMTLAVSDTVKLPSDSSAKIVSEGLLGSKYVALEAGSDDEMLEGGDQILYTQSSMNLENLIGKFAFGSPQDPNKASKKK